MQDKIKELLAKSPDRDLTKDERVDRAVSFAYGNVKLENPDVKRSTVTRETQRVYAAG